jgi:hypothetical protein
MRGGCCNPKRMLATPTYHVSRDVMRLNDIIVLFV